MVTPLTKRIGLLGGSFNPAHEGHVYISELALIKLGLNEIWWLVSPQNPLKEKETLAPYKNRLEEAKKISRAKAIRVSDIEKQKGFQFSVDTLKYLKSHYPKAGFVWLMGADCFANFEAWKSWREIMDLVPVAVFPRPGFIEKALKGKAATAFAKNRLPGDQAQNLIVTKPPAWVYIDIRPVSFSGTEIRKGIKGPS